MLTIGDASGIQVAGGHEPRAGQEFREFTEKSHPGKWLVLFYWPMDFTFICPTEIASFPAGARLRRSRRRCSA